MKKFAFLILIVILFSCHGKQEEAALIPIKSAKESCSKAKGKNLTMYEMSEMSLLMEQMYVDNQRLKERIKRGDTIGEFPNHFLQIHKAVMTDDSENDAFFKKQAANFIQAQELIYKDPKNAKQHFNEGVDACLNCHEVKCAGPIPRIKKLYIQ